MPARTLTPRIYERQLGETEVSYFLPSREDGVNDMWVIIVVVRLRFICLIFARQVSSPRFSCLPECSSTKQGFFGVGHPQTQASVARIKRGDEWLSRY